MRQTYRKNGGLSNFSGSEIRSDFEMAIAGIADVSSLGHLALIYACDRIPRNLIERGCWNVSEFCPIDPLKPREGVGSRMLWSNACSSISWELAR
jgi:hypothetical protein